MEGSHNQCFGYDLDWDYSGRRKDEEESIGKNRKRMKRWHKMKGA